MPIFILGFAAGAYWLQTQAVLPTHAGTTLAIACLACLLAGYALRHQHALLRLLSGCTGGVVLGFFWAAWLAQLALAPQLALADEGRDITVTGTIASPCMSTIQLYTPLTSRRSTSN